MWAVIWQAAAGPLEHLGIVPHAHPTSTLSDSGTSSKAGAFTGDHHHLPDVAFSSPPLVILVSGEYWVHTPAPISPPDSPVFGITHPPQLS